MKRLIWTPLAADSYQEEQLYILRKWNIGEVDKFTKLVQENVANLCSGTNEGAPYTNDISKFVISKQTTLFFKNNPNDITLLLIWNNQKDPNTLNKILRKLKL
ncbi:type II toxin-antitoxin system RelE/ParE family toxin [Dokdonia sinensis]|uniref:Type II toxin-antitoxin system RelE/ParE family toxin n=1 Tax=Dokdonia sinensis TaxID=2479847 RepID=A0A3M0G4C9_9FLAO|nr:type II toxin-antitoxin system RelE/ParE family toxin [Dokdonia sinensis]RMB56773.1 type II toxin-antitoxin system RelE/ParE family toxin [Dokdonia sinensis]